MTTAAEPEEGRGGALYIDALNYSHFFFDTASSAGASSAAVGSPAALRAALARVALLCAAARRRGLRLAAFVDCACVSAEAAAKRRARRARGVREAARGVPHAAPQLLAEMFLLCGAPALLSRGADCDDTLAARAAADGADVLSRDADFARYFVAAGGAGGGRAAAASAAPPFRVFGGFDERALAKGALVLRARGGARAAGAGGAAPRALLSPPPAAWDAADGPALPALLRETNAFSAGTPSPLTRALGNPHACARLRPLRRALYGLALAGASSGEGKEDRASVRVRERRVRESWPEWCASSGTVDFVEEEVPPLVAGAEGGAGAEGADQAAEAAAALALLRGPPARAFAHCFPREAAFLRGVGAAGAGAVAGGASAAQWLAHAHACRAVVLELVAAATGASLLQLLLEEHDEGGGGDGVEWGS